MYRNNYRVKLSSAIAMIMAGLLAYYILLTDSLVLSIDSIIDFSQEFELPGHLCVLGLLPIYISAVLFGAAMFGLYFAKLIRQYFASL